VKVKSKHKDSKYLEPSKAVINANKVENFYIVEKKYA